MRHLLTPRMSGDAITVDHFELIRRLHRDPLVMRTLSADGEVLPDEKTLLGLQAQEQHWAEHGFGLWLFRERSDGRFIGRGGLKEYRIEGEAVVGLAYAVISTEWGQGYATEMAAASLEAGFERLGLAEIASWTLPVNLSSQRVMEKLGLQYVRDFEFAGLPHRFYRLSQASWKDRR